jgi:alpha-L-rhamnosidase
VTWDSQRVQSDETLHIRYAGEPLEAGERYIWKVRLWDESGAVSAWSSPASWTMGLWGGGWSHEPGEVTPRPEVVASWIGAPLPGIWDENVSLPATFLRREFNLPAHPVRAMLYASALGLYELRLNGQRVGDAVLAPEWTNYHQKVQYQGYDVTHLLQPGQNALAALLGAGWYAGRIGMAEWYANLYRGIYGRRLALITQLRIELDNGQQVMIVTDGGWASTIEGPIRSADLLDGEVYDARLEIPGWDQPGFDDQSWAKAVPLKGPRLVAQPNEPIRITRTLRPVGLSEPQPGQYIFDLGQNMVGWVQLKLAGRPGLEVRLRYGEMLNPDGTLYRANLRGAPQVDTYICRGGQAEVFEPHFTYHGFRYVEVTGLETAPSLADLAGCVLHSAAPETGQFASSSPLFNKIMDAIQWTQRGNLHSTPTDCPQRDERLGWMGDAQVFSQTAIFNRDMAAFFTKWLGDVRDAQAPDGRFPDFAPHPYDPNQCFSGNPGWGDAGVIVPWRMYVNYADADLLAEQFESARRYVDWSARTQPGLLWQDGSVLAPLWYGDWLNSDTFADLPGYPQAGGQLPKEIFSTAYFAHSAQLVARMALVLGRTSEARHYADLAERIRDAFNRAYVSADGRIQGDTQAGYALALSFDLLPEHLRPMVARHMLATLEPYGGGLSTGIHSTVRMMLELSRHGYHDAAYALLAKTTIPSWGYMVEHGGTTIWERWDGWVEDRSGDHSGFQDPGMNSFNHYAIGAVGEWMWRVMVGIQPDESAPGYKHFTIQPVPPSLELRQRIGLNWVDATYHSIRGPIQVAWKIEDGLFRLTVQVPCNTSATVILPGSPSHSHQVGSGKWEFECKV